MQDNAFDLFSVSLLDFEYCSRLNEHYCLCTVERVQIIQFNLIGRQYSEVAQQIACTSVAKYHFKQREETYIQNLNYEPYSYLNCFTHTYRWNLLQDMFTCYLNHILLAMKLLHFA